MQPMTVFYPEINQKINLSSSCTPASALAQWGGSVAPVGKDKPTSLRGIANRSGAEHERAVAGQGPQGWTEPGRDGRGDGAVQNQHARFLVVQSLLPVPDSSMNRPTNLGQVVRGRSFGPGKMSMNSTLRISTCQQFKFELGALPNRQNPAPRPCIWVTNLGDLLETARRSFMEGRLTFRTQPRLAQ